MNAERLITESGAETTYHQCGKCRAVKLSKAKADACCLPPTCALCTGPLNVDGACPKCWPKIVADEENGRFFNATKMEKWDGFVFVDGLGYHQGFFESVADLVDWCRDERKPVPAYAWTCPEKRFVRIHIDGILEDIAEAGYEGFEDDSLAELDDLKSAIASFEDANKDVVSYEPDMTVAVLVKDVTPAPAMAPTPNKPLLDTRQETINRMMQDR